MESADIELVEKHRKTDPALNELYRQHLDYEKKLEKFDKKLFLSPNEELQRKELQKLKLKGKDLIEKILLTYR
ncbi:MAG: DUF465 domain-containing protein [Deltaproteobacteria bacterium]|nr:DUF465 domain-containing protein [Deltaproteobacteria bacterium]